MTVLNYSEQPQERMLEYLRLQAKEPTNEPLITRAVYIMNDWTGGQVDQFFRAIERPEPNECCYYEQYALLAEIALRAGEDRLTPYAAFVANALYEKFPILKQAVAQAALPNVKKNSTARLRPVRRAPGYVYVVQSPTGAYKIGRTIDPTDRMRTFSIKLPFEVEYVCLVHTDDMYGLEASLHDCFTEKRINGEWFALAPEDIEYVKGLAS